MLSRRHEASNPETARSPPGGPRAASFHNEQSRCCCELPKHRVSAPLESWQAFHDNSAIICNSSLVGPASGPMARHASAVTCLILILTLSPTPDSRPSPPDRGAGAAVEAGARCETH